MLYRALLACSATLLITIHSDTDARTCKDEIRRNNVIGNALITTLFRGLNGELTSWQDWGESLAYGASGGYLFYQSRIMISEGDESRGIMTAYLASSLTENASKGDHPLGHLRYGYGPLEFAWTTPWSRKYEDGVHISINAIDSWNIVRKMVSGDAENFRIKNGVVLADDTTPDDGFDGATLGRMVIIRPEHQDDQGLWHHELIHTTQNLQFGSFGATDFYPFGIDEYRPIKRIRQFGDKYNINVRIEWFNELMRGVERTQPYENRWREIEAARLAQQTSPLHDDGIGACSASVGFSMQF